MWRSVGLEQGSAAVLLASDRDSLRLRSSRRYVDDRDEFYQRCEQSRHAGAGKGVGSRSTVLRTGLSARVGLSRIFIRHTEHPHGPRDA